MNQAAKIAVFADKTVGKAVLECFCAQEILPVVVVVQSADYWQDKIELKSWLVQANIPILIAEDLKQNPEKLEQLKPDLGILAWWPDILKKPLLDIPRLGYLNFHPSLLPYNRGKHPNFWNLIEQVPFGVSIHWVDESIDGGDIAFQQELSTDWLDNGKSLYERATTACCELFTQYFNDIVNLQIPRVPQQKHDHAIRYAKELTSACEIQLDKQYSGRELLNLLRAKTFAPYPACYFEDAGKRYEVSVEIKSLTGDKHEG